MSGYSKTPLWKKIGFKEDHTWRFINGSAYLESLLQPLPEGTSRTEVEGRVDIILWCCNDLDQLETQMRVYMKDIFPVGMMWVLWYKKSSKKQRDVNEDVIRDTALAVGLVDVKVCAVDQEWSALKLVYRLKDR